MNEQYIVIKSKYSNNVVILELQPKIGSVFSFISGQYTMLSIENINNTKQSRPFSISSSPTNKKLIQLAIKVHGDFTQKVSKLKIGDMVTLSKPNGFFTFDEKNKNIVFLAGGIGITPFMSAIKYVSEKNLNNKITLIYSNKTKKDIVFLNDLEEISKNHTHIQIIFTLTDDNSEKYENGYIDIKMIKKYTHVSNDVLFSLCGPVPFMESIKHQLLETGIKNDNIDMERFK